MTENRTAKISINSVTPADTELIKTLTDICHKHHITLTVKGLTRKGAPKVNPEGEVTLLFPDIKSEITLPNPKAARKWLRKHSLSVTVCRKETNKWIFPKASDAVKIHFSIK